MKQILTTFLILIYTLTAVCQDTKIVTKKFSNSNQISESYYVLKSDGKTKHGEYISYFPQTAEESKQIKKGTLKLEAFIKQKGNYNNGKKNGEWTEYLKHSIIHTQGKYENDKKIGIWITSKERGQVFEKYDFDNNKKLQPFIKVIAEYPKSAIELGLEGIVKINYQVNKDCSITNITIEKGLSADCNKTAIESIAKTEGLLKKYSSGCDEKIETIEIEFKLK